MEYDQFLKQAGPQLDLDWRKYRRRASRRHVEERIGQLSLAGYEEYLERLRTDPEEAGGLADLMRVTVSRFFRDRDCWRELAELVLPELLKNNAGGPLRAWSIGCCGGEEPYSLTILFLSQSGQLAAGNQHLKILATDIDGQVLARASRGCYDAGSLREVPPGLLEKFFREEKHRKCVNAPVKKPVTFLLHNFMEDALPPEGIDLLLCRYLAFTYYRGSRLRRAALRLHQALRPRGALMIGLKEQMRGQQDLFEPWPGTSSVFRKKSDD